MSHVDEGTLHAYLDGELSTSERATLESHLTTCATCREKLGEERALLQRASSLLGSARPAERPVPPFEHVRRTPKRSPWYVSSRIVWAASIVLAVGLGYYLRGGGVETKAVETNAPSALATAAPDSMTTVAAAPADKAAESFRPSPKPRAQEPAAAPAVASGGRLDSGPAGLIAQQPGVRLRGASPEGRQRETDSLAAARSAITLNDAVVTAPAAAAAPAPTQPRAARVKTESQSVRNLVSTTWPLISQGAATSMLGERPVGVPGLATRQIRRSPAGDTVVVEQALDSRTVIQIFQRPASDGYEEAERARTDRVLARYVGRLRVEIAGPVSTDSLNRLLEQVEALP